MEALSKDRIEEFVKQFPALKEPLKDAAYEEAGIWVNVYIRVKRADETLMFYRPRHADGERSSYGHESGGQCALRSTGYAVLLDGAIRYRRTEERKSFRMAELFEQHGARPGSVEYLMLVEIYDVYERTSSKRGKRIGREIQIMVYRPPVDGFEELMKRLDPRLNVRLNLNDVYEAMRKNEDIYGDVKARLDELARVFDCEFYLSGVKEMYDKGGCGMSGTFGNVQVRSLAFAGDILFTLQRGDDTLSFSCRDGGLPSGMGVRSISATLPVARELLQIVIDTWQAAPDKSAIYTHNPNMSVWKNLC